MSAFPRTKWDFPGILSDLIGDLTLADQPIEVKIFSTDIAFLKKKDPQVEADSSAVPGVVDIAQRTYRTPARPSTFASARGDAQHFGLTTEDIAQRRQPRDARTNRISSARGRSTRQHPRQAETRFR